MTSQPSPSGGEDPLPAPGRTTRICVKNVPPNFDEAKLRQHLLTGGAGGEDAAPDATAPVITDCRILRTKEGKSRKLAFVGFKTPGMASRAVSDFHGTYARTSRLTVELAFSKKQRPEDVGYRPWSKHSVGSSRHDREVKRMLPTEGGDGLGKGGKLGEGKGTRSKKRDATKESEEKDEEVDEELRRKKEEFLRAMGASVGPTSAAGVMVGKAKLWSNDDVGALVDEAPASGRGEKAGSGMKDEAGEDGMASDGGSSDDDSASDDDSVDSGGEGADALAGRGRSYAGAALSDMDFLRSKATGKDDLTDDDDDDDDDDDEGDTGEAKKDNTGQGEEDGESVSSSSSSSVPSSSDESDSGSDSDSEQDEDKEESHDIASEEKDGVEPNQSSPLIVGANDEEVAPDRLFVRNLPFSATEEEVREAFEPFGAVSECHIPIDDTKKNKGYAFVRFDSADDAAAAMEAMDGSDFQGRLMHVLSARRGREGGQDGSADATAEDGADMTYKQRQELARQKGAEKATAGWSASFVRGDAVVDNLSDRLGLSKGDILSVKDGLSSGGAAVRLALGETHIIEENREYFRQHGVDMDVLVSGATGKGREDGKDQGHVRSATMVLVKNLPYDTNLEDLTKLFHGAGDAPDRILLPPSHTIALVEYGHASDARRAFRKLAYKRFKHIPLYLEWAPLAAKTKELAAAASSSGQKAVGEDGEALQRTGSVPTEEPSIGNGNHDGEIEPEEATRDAGVSHTVYVKNLNFSTTEQQLQFAFEKAGHRVRAVKIPTKLAPVKRITGRKALAAEPEMKKLSMGFGFVECESEVAVRKAIQKLQGTILDGHALEMKLSSKGISKTSIQKISSTTTSTNGEKRKKLMVRNVPFQATRTELLQLFGSFGHLKKVRLPKKFDGSHRGFAFVEFLTGQEAQNAMKALSSTHLYGRHLVLEWADDKDDVQTLRDKAKRDIQVVGISASAPKNKKIRFT